MLERLADHLRGQKQHRELFEVLKMQIRQRLGMNLLQELDGPLDDATEKLLEEGLLEACREVGTRMLQAGEVRDGWTCLRPVCDRAEAQKLIAEIEVDEDNLEEIVEVCLHEGVDPERGYALVLEHYGTCNSITTLESAMYHLSRADQQKTTSLLLRHVHRELREAVAADIAQQEGQQPAETTLRELIADREWLFGEHSYHIDTTHLASTVKFSRVLQSEEDLRTALDLTAYGRRLNEQFQYQGDEPFTDIYPSHALFFQALLGENLNEATAYFRTKAERVDAYQQGAMSIEVYVDLLARLSRPQEALEAAITLTPENVHPVGYAPSLLELAEQAGEFDRLLEHYRQRGELMNYAVSLAYSAKVNS